jgi:large subunit ribosomal protein L4
MIEVPVYNQEGQQVSTLKVDEKNLGGEVNAALLKQALVMYHANLRQGTVKTKGRGEVEGSTRKLFRQKGTGNARQGSIRQPVRKGGGHAKQKTPKDWRLAMPKKQRRAARDHALLSKLLAKDVKVIDALSLPEPKTKVVAGMFKKLGIDRSVVFAVDGTNAVVVKSARNIDRTTLTTVDQLNAWDLLRHRTLLVTKAGIEKLTAGKESAA